jgi:hypothetical protein
MQKYVASKFEIKHGIHSVVVASDVDHCCYIHITGDEDLNLGEKKCSIPFLGVGMLRSYPTNMSWCWRIKSALKLLRGTLFASELEFWTREDADRFIAAFKETADLVFKEEV